MAGFSFATAALSAGESSASTFPKHSFCPFKAALPRRNGSPSARFPPQEHEIFIEPCAFNRRLPASHSMAVYSKTPHKYPFYNQIFIKQRIIRVKKKENL